jgi:hypothetical protein
MAMLFRDWKRSEGRMAWLVTEIIVRLVEERAIDTRGGYVLISFEKVFFVVSFEKNERSCLIKLYAGVTSFETCFECCVSRLNDLLFKG